MLNELNTTSVPKRLTSSELFINGYKSLVSAGYRFEEAERLPNGLYFATFSRGLDTIMLTCAARDASGENVREHVGTADLSDVLDIVNQPRFSHLKEVYTPLAQVVDRAHWTLLVITPTNRWAQFCDPGRGYALGQCMRGLSFFKGYSLAPMTQSLMEAGFWLRGRDYTAIQPMTDSVACGQVTLFLLKSIARLGTYDKQIEFATLMEDFHALSDDKVPTVIYRAAIPYAAHSGDEHTSEQAEGNWQVVIPVNPSPHSKSQ